MNNDLRRRCASLLRAGLAGLLALAALPSLAALSDIANAPLFTSSANSVKPNIMFILDDSGSMSRDYMPDNANFSSTKYGRRAAQCNGLAYNPTVSYQPPVDSAGTSVGNASLSVITPNPTTQLTTTRTLSNIAAMPASASGTVSVTVTTSNRQNGWYDPGDTVTVYQSGDATRYFSGDVVSWNASTGVVVINLNAGRVVGTGSFNPARIGFGEPRAGEYFTYSGSQPKLGFTYSSSGNVITTTTFYLECNSVEGSSPGSGVFTKVVVTNTSSEAQNYANWYQYYRTRMQMMKTSVSLAFKNVDNKYRVGYSTINKTDAAEDDDFLNIRDFDATQKSSFYSKLNSASPVGSTPLRGALSKAGQYFANKARNQTVDPMQYACQRNFTILSTDGYWNTPSESTSAPKYGPYALNNDTAVGQQDGSGTLRPMLDGTVVTRTTTESWTVTGVTVATGVQPREFRESAVKGTVTNVPQQGYQHTAYTNSFLVPAANIQRPPSSCGPNCRVTVTFTAHPFSTTDTFTISGGGENDYHATNTRITKIDANRFYYVLGSRPSGASGTYTFTLTSSSGCSGGGRKYLAFTQSYDRRLVTTTTYTISTVTTSTLTTVTTTTRITRYQKVTKVIDGVAQAPTLSPPDGPTPAPGSPHVTSTVMTSPSVTSSTPISETSTIVTTTFQPPASSLTAASTFTGVSGCSTVTPSITATTATATTTAALAPVTFSNSLPSATTTGTLTTSTLPEVETETPTPRLSVTGETTTNGTQNTLADVAAYYYNTDLRDTSLSNCSGALGIDVCANTVPGTPNDAYHSYGDTANWQHMTTFTLGMGLTGFLKYDANYQTARSGDFYEIVNGTKNWPVPSADDPSALDDLWHAAVNGRGKFFSASDPAAVATGLTSALNQIKAITGAASAASTSSLNPVQGDNFIFVAQFTTQDWVGDVLAYSINTDNGAVSTDPLWSARTQLDNKTWSTRNIYYRNASATNKLKRFTFQNLSDDGLAGHFASFCTKAGANGASTPEQCPGLVTADASAANTGTNLVAYLSGDQTKTYFRPRRNVLGDIINASPLHVGRPSFAYTESGYGTFKTTHAGRTPIVLAAANDGMLHAFRRDTGEEVWAYVPSFVMPNMYKLADNSYSNNHSFFVDGSPQVGDIHTSSGWKTIVVGGLNAGGRGYYALDVTDPLNPKSLWEFTDTDLGLTFGNPIITKSTTEGKWVVAFTSGYNNVSPGDGNGYLYILDAETGTQLRKIPTLDSTDTAVGTSGTPSGLGKMNAWVDTISNNSAARYYAGDMLGNLWRFDVDNLVQPHGKAHRIAEFELGDGTRQSITVKPALAEIEYNNTPHPVVFLATGRYLGTTDLTDTKTQSVYAVKDTMDTTSHGNVRSNSAFVTQTLTISGTNRQVTNAKSVNWSAHAGWRVDLPQAGERVNVNPELVLSTLLVGSNLPSTDTCSIGGNSFLYMFDIATGATAAGEAYAGISLGGVLVQGITTVQLPDGSTSTYITQSNATLRQELNPPPTSGTVPHRTQWRELSD